VDDPDNPGEKKMIEIGRIVSIEKDHVAVERAFRGEKVGVFDRTLLFQLTRLQVCIKIESRHDHYVLGRHFEEKNEFVSKITRKSLDLLKVHFKEDVDKLQEEGWPFIVKVLKKTFAL
jgi:translation initiation factor 5B